MSKQPYKISGALLYPVLGALALGVMCVSVCAGSVPLPLGETIRILWCALWGLPAESGATAAILLSVRLPRVICVALCGAALSLCGAAMQGLLRNPLADGSTLGVSSGASLGAIAAILTGVSVPGLPFAGTVLGAMVSAFASLVLILALAYSLDRSLATQTIILIGVIFNMFASSIISLLIAFSGEKLKSITFWTMGSLAGSNYTHALVLLIMLTLGGGVLFTRSRALNAFALGEDNARHLGVDVRRVKLSVLIAVSALIGVCVSIGGTIGFVGLVVPHMTRMIAGPNHRRLLPVCCLSGAVFLMLCDLAARTVLSPVELPIGVVTSLIGSITFVTIFYRSRKAGKGTC